MLKLTRPLAFLDTETTGLDTQKDRIITFAVHVTEEDGTTHQHEWKFNPGVLINPENSAIHGITNEMVKDWPPFSAKAKTIMDWLRPCDFAGFNTVYDLSMLSQEFGRVGIVFDLDGKAVLDVGMIYKKKNPRTLTAAVSHYCQKDHAAAHGALADTLATRDVFEKMLEFHEPLAEMTLEQVARYSMEDDKDGSVPLDLANTLRVRKDGVVVYGIKKARGVEVGADPGLAQWILRTPFPAQTHRILKKVLEDIEKNYALTP